MADVWGSYNLKQTNQLLCAGHSIKTLMSQSSLKHLANDTECVIKKVLTSESWLSLCFFPRSLSAYASLGVQQYMELYKVLGKNAESS